MTNYWIEAKDELKNYRMVESNASSGSVFFQNKRRPNQRAVFINQFKTIRFLDDNELHRRNGPAEVFENGRYGWFEHGKIHRVGGPAIKLMDGSEFYMEDNKFHRLDGPAFISKNDGIVRWYLWGNDVTDWIIQKNWKSIDTDERELIAKLTWKGV